jgi:uncharacterized protein (TIGR04222 family)
MTPDTWGIPGPTFLIYFLGAVVVVSILATVHRRAMFAGSSTADIERLGPQQVAYLNGRDKLAVYTALGGLRAAGAIGSGPDRTLVQTGPLASGVTPLDTAVYNAAGRRIRAREINKDQWVAAAVAQLRHGLESAGLVVTAEQRRTARLWAVLGAALVVLGIVRLVAGVRNGHPVGFLVPSIFLAAFLAAAMLATASRIPTRTAAKGMSRLRQQHQYLSPRQSPSYATYGAAGAAMGVALFGAASLYAMDPAFAAEAEIQRINAAGASSSWSGSDGGGSSCGGGGGCGGGGCGGGGCGG